MAAPNLGLGLVELDGRDALPRLFLVTADDVPGLRQGWPEATNAWLNTTGFEVKPGATAALPAADGTLLGALGVVDDPGSPFSAAAALKGLPSATYRLAEANTVPADVAALGWALERYRFRQTGDGPQLALAVDRTALAMQRAETLAQAVHLARNLVNTPANRLGPEELAAAVAEVAKAHGAAIQIIVGEDLLRHGFPAIHAVGRASSRAPRLIDLAWGDPAHPKLTLVGKGVCFDTGGLDIKPPSNMLLMKKDMGGAAVMLGLAQAIMAQGLKVRLRLLIPAVENAISGDAFRPGDVIDTRKRKTVEIGNTDAEGRLVLADALALAFEENPDLVLDAATLTGAARVALGADLPALFTPDDDLAAAFAAAAAEARDPLWRLPLHAPYRKMLDSPVADINNTGAGGFAGAITAALFLQDFVAGERWAHLDIYGHNPQPKPGRPKGGEATALLALHRLLERRYGD
ncbi:MAG: leucyl aminopeptidase family protein [Geminicoccaceae bacterium]|nr:MAG: leucyl aminopeptidase family protein [Geminicoccaceae bacterium]